MRYIGYGKFVILLMSLFALAVPFAFHKIKRYEIRKIAQDVYIYGYPLVTSGITSKVTTNTEYPADKKAPFNQMFFFRNFPDYQFKYVVAPNHDTLYNYAWLNLELEPYVISLPDTKGRYILTAVLDAWTNVVASVGSRTTGTNEQVYLISGPNWHGKVPSNMTHVKLPTNLAWLITRIYCDGTAADIHQVNNLQDQISLVPLSSYGKHFIPPKGSVDHSIDDKTPVVKQVNDMNIEAFFNVMATLMEHNAPSSADSDIVRKMKTIGLIPGKPFNPSDKVRASIEGIVKKALDDISNYTGNTRSINGWNYNTDLGNYGTKYKLRAYTSLIGFGANLSSDAIYPVAKTDEEGELLSGNNNYVIHFDEGQLPPAKAFWSITMYDQDGFFIQNSIDRYNIGSGDKFKFNPDGSLDIIIQHYKPSSEDKTSNWLPSPKGNFFLILRLYEPEKALFDNKWSVPPVVKQISSH